MQIWRYALAGSLITALAFIPQGKVTQTVSMPTLESNPTFASLKVQKPTPTNVLPARSPVSLFSRKSNKPLTGVTICIDPGHGGQGGGQTGYTGGTVGIATRQTESDVNLRVSLLLRQYLEAAGAKIVMTRISDDRCQDGTCQRSELDFRSNTAKRAKADLFISVHHNEATNKPDINYTAVYYPKNISASRPLAQNISKSVSHYMGIRNSGAKVGSYRVLNQIDMPGVIVEASFMSNPSEDKRLANLSYNKLEAKAIATGILNYFRTTKGTDVNFRQIFAPLDDQADSAQAIADATMVGKKIVERKSMFNKTYEEVTVDRSGKQVASRPVGNSTLAAKKSATTKRNNSGKSTASAPKPSAKVTQVVQQSRQNAKSLQKSNSSRVVISERNKAIGTSKPVI